MAPSNKPGVSDAMEVKHLGEAEFMERMRAMRYEQLDAARHQLLFSFWP